MKAIKIAIALFCFTSLAKSNDDCPTLLHGPKESSQLGEIRVRAIRGWDKLITWALNPKNTAYVFTSPSLSQKLSLTNDDIKAFSKNYGYFSIFHPIVGIVTEKKQDIKVSNCLLNSVSQNIKDSLGKQFAQDEILAKIIAYRSLDKGALIDLEEVTYRVDEVIDMWKGMPAFGLIPNSLDYPPVLLYRGTDLNLVSEKGWASILSDLDTNGPGYSTYLGAQKKIRKWLNKVKKTPARVLGHSLGGVFVFYTLIHEHDLVAKDHPSTAFNPPGISERLFEKWKSLSKDLRPQPITYLNKGDFISKIGFLLPGAWEISTPHPMGVVESHVSLITAEPNFTLTEVDVDNENALRKKQSFLRFIVD